MNNVDKNTFLNINLKSISGNYKIIENKVGKNCIVAATVKANAYGLGVKKIVPSLTRIGCKFFFVATTNEAIQLRKINKKIKIFILNGLITKELNLIHKYNLIPVINSLSQLKKIEHYQKQKKITLNISLHFDTGMSRLGFDKNETKELINNKSRLIQKSKILLVMSHLSCADNSNSKLNKIQLNQFNSIRSFFPKSLHSLANSAGILLGKKYHLDMVRPGISLYGGHCQMNEKKIYNDVISLKAKLIQIREIYKGDTIGYGATYKAKKRMKVGTLGFGYADGFNRLFSNNYKILLNKKRIDIIGRVSMDLTTVDLTNLNSKEDLMNKEFEIIGSQFSINYIASLINTVPYEILTNLGKRYQRRYISI
tara:strand:+ start:276 stop:1379 length:1104 start_codon:yes stop_codon:yes gene_type:complete